MSEQLPDHVSRALRRAKAAMPSTRYDAGLEDEAQELAYNAMEAQEAHVKLQYAVEALQLFPLSVEAWGIIGYFLLHAENAEGAVEMFETAVAAGRQIHPEWGPHRTEPIEWGYIENRPYLRAMQGLALAQHDSGNTERAIETAELVLFRWHEHSSLCQHICSWYIEVNRLEDAEAFISQASYMSATLAYSKVLLTYIKVRDGQVDSAALDEVLAVALDKNLLLPDILVDTENYPTVQPDGYSPGEESEALTYVLDNHTVWQNTAGAIQWLSSMRDRQGRKPDEQVLVQLLRKHVLLIELGGSTSRFRATQNKDQMLGHGLPDFRLRPEVSRPHANASPIHVHRHSFDRSLESSLWTQFQYEQVEAIPFWHVLAQQQQDEPQDNVLEQPHDTEPARRCNYHQAPETQDLSECVRFQESKVWRNITVDLLPLITSFLDLKDKAAVASLSQAWLQAATADVEVSIDPEVVGPDLDPVLRFVANRFRNLQDIHLTIDQGHFLGLNDETLVELSGVGLNYFFGTCQPLKSITVFFGEACEEQIYPILVEGFDSLGRHGHSAQVLKLTNICFDGIPPIVQLLHPFTNLRILSLDYISFYTGFAFHDTATVRMLSGELAVALSGLVQLRKLSVKHHLFTDNDIRALLPIFGELRALELQGCFGETGEPEFVTDESLQFIAQHCPKLQHLNMRYNRRLTFAGIRHVVAACPLRELQAYDAGLASAHLEELSLLSSSLMLVRYGRGYGGLSPGEQEHLRKASIASSGRIAFVGDYVYEPRFDENLMEAHKRTMSRLESCVVADESNGWNEWEDLL